MLSVLGNRLCFHHVSCRLDNKYHWVFANRSRCRINHLWYRLGLSGFVVSTTVRYHIRVGLSGLLPFDIAYMTIVVFLSPVQRPYIRWSELFWPALLRRLVFNMFYIDSTCTILDVYTVLSNTIEHLLICVHIYYTPPCGTRKLFGITCRHLCGGVFDAQTHREGR